MDDYSHMLRPEPPDRELTPREVLVMTLDFLRSEFYRFVWLPRYQAEMELTDINAMRQIEPHVRLQWLDRRAALRAIEEAWLMEWLNPPERDRRDEYNELIDIEPELLHAAMIDLDA